MSAGGKLSKQTEAARRDSTYGRQIPGIKTRMQKEVGSFSLDRGAIKIIKSLSERRREEEK